jgi:hyperosmotically inducible protein
MIKTRVLAGTAVLGLVVAAACDRAQTNREAKHAAEQVNVAAAQAGDKLADGWLTTKIQAQFFADDDVKSRYITVKSRDGVVTLKGFVDSDDARRQVLEIARTTDGVKQIDDRQLLIGRPATESFDTAVNGTALNGSASSAASPVPVATTGVLTTSPAPKEDSTVVSLIQAKYFLDPGIKSRAIEVQAAHGVVTLRGSVASETERAQALSLARSTEGVQRVEDGLMVDAGLGQ